MQLEAGVRLLEHLQGDDSTDPSDDVSTLGPVYGVSDLEGAHSPLMTHSGCLKEVLCELRRLFDGAVALATGLTNGLRFGLGLSQSFWGLFVRLKEN